MAQINKVALRYKDGRVIKGTTQDFLPGKPIFHIHVTGGDQADEVKAEDLKAVFFVKDFAGRPEYHEKREFPENPQAGKGRKIAVLFNDGELLTGFTLGYDPKRPGFFVMPTDEMGNNERVYVLRSAVRDVGFGAKADTLNLQVKKKSKATTI